MLNLLVNIVYVNLISNIYWKNFLLLINKHGRIWKHGTATLEKMNENIISTILKLKQNYLGVYCQ